MYRIIATVFILLLGFTGNHCYSQNKTDSLSHKNNNDSLLLTTNSDTLLLTDGEIIITTILDTAGATIKYKKTKRPEKTSYIDKDELFSVRNKQGEHILYIQDTLYNLYSIAEMRLYILGQQDARKNLKLARKPFIANMLLSAAAGVTGSFISPLAPFLFTGLFSKTKVKIKPENVSNPDYIDDDAYVAGYKQEAHKKRKIQVLTGGGIGLLVGIATSFVLRANGIEITRTY